MRMFVASLAVAALLTPVSLQAAEISGVYLESRTCQVYTGPCFANAETGLSGKKAIMAWRIDKGVHDGVDLAGLNVVMVLSASDTLGHQGIDDAKEVKSLILVDQRASEKQHAALVKFAKSHAGRAGKAVVRVDSTPIEMSLDQATLDGKLKAGKEVTLATRKARPEDCICSNESAYYPPLTKLKNFVPGVAMEGEFRGRGLGATWSTPGDRSAYMGVFGY